MSNELREAAQAVLYGWDEMRDDNDLNKQWLEDHFERLRKALAAPDDDLHSRLIAALAEIVRLRVRLGDDPHAQVEPVPEGIPPVVWLQLYGDSSPDAGPPDDYRRNEVTWCWHQINEHDVKYVLAKQGHEAAQIKRLQARIDALMLEYCPDEMSSEQRAEWARHQRPHE